MAAMEAEFVILRQETAATLALAAGANRDVADFRAELRGQTRMLSALRETQLAHYAELKADAAEFKADTSELKAGLAQIVRMLEGLGGTADDEPPRA